MILSQEVPLEKKMATYASILAWRIPWTEEPDGSQGHKESDMTEHTRTHIYTVTHTIFFLISEC